MEKYSALLSDRELKALRSIIGKELKGIVSPGIHIVLEGNILTTYWSLSLHIGDQYLVLGNEWLETKNWLDYWKVSAKLRKRADGMKYNEQGNMVNPPVTISFKGHPKITRVEVYDAKETTQGETVHYDKAVILYTEDGKSLCFSPQESIADAMEFTSDEKCIDDVIYNCSVRYATYSFEREK